MIRLTRAAPVLVAFALTSSLGSSAAASDVRECLSSHADAQVRRRAGKLREARKLLVACSADACPADVRRDCGAWLGDVDQGLPSIVVVTGAGDAAPARVRVVADGELLAERVDGLAIPLDPGPHALRIECANGIVHDARVQLAEGEKRRRIDVSCEDRSRGDAAGAAAVDSSASAHANANAERIPVATVVLAGVALAGAASFATFAALGRSKEASLAESCSGHCLPSDVDPVRTKYAIADVSLGVAVLSAAGAALVYFLSRSKAPAPPLATRVTLSPAGMGMTALGQF